MCLVSAAAILLIGSAEANRQLKIGDICRFSNVAKCGTCEGGEFQTMQGSDKKICAPKFKECSAAFVESDDSCSCCSDLNGYLQTS